VGKFMKMLFAPRAERLAYVMGELQDELNANIVAWKRLQFPACKECGRRDAYTVTSGPTFATDRFSRQRITSTLLCGNCGLRGIARVEPGGKWSFDLQS
jgi:hypothetical protein